MFTFLLLKNFNEIKKHLYFHNNLHADIHYYEYNINTTYSTLNLSQVQSKNNIQYIYN